MRVLQATTARGWSGGTEQCLLLCKYMKELGVEADVLAVKGSELERRAKRLGIRVLNFPNTKKFSLREARELYSLIKDYQVVNTHISKAHWFIWSSLLFKKRRPIVVYTRRVPYPLSFLSKITKYNLKTDGLIAVSPQIYLELLKTPFLKGKLKYIPSGVELNRFYPGSNFHLREKLGIPTEALVFVNVANYSHVKGHHILLPAFKEFLKGFGGDAYLLLVGRDTKSQEATKEIRKLGLEGKVLQLGFRRDVPEILRASDVFLFPSLNEGIAGSLLQAMATGLIVVSSYVGGIRSYLKDGVNGIAVNPGKVNELLKGIERAVKNLENEEMRRNALETARSFDIKRVAEETLDFYEELLNGKG